MGASNFFTFFGASNCSYSSSDYSTFLAALPFTWTTFFAGFYSYDSSELETLATGFLATTFLGFSSSSDSSSDSWTTFLAGTTAFWAGDFGFGVRAFWTGDFPFCKALTGATYSDSYSEEVSGLTGFLVGKGFWTGDFALRAGEAALGTGFPLALTGATSSDSYYYEDCLTTFLAGTAGFWRGDLAFTTFLGFYSELSSSSEDYFLATFFGGTTAFWTGDLALVTFFGCSSSLYSSEDYFLATFLATATGFLATTT